MHSPNWIHDLSPFLIRFSDTFGIRYYGLAYVLGFVGAWFLMRRAALTGRTRLPAALMGDFIVALVLGVLLGGRIGYFLLYQFPAVRADPSILLRVWEGGMSFHGGLVGVLAALAFYAWRHQQSFLHLGDLVASVAPLGLLFGRIANFINGELWGKETTVPWAVIFPQSDHSGLPAHLIAPRHPSQLYEAFLEGLVLLVLLQWRFWRTDLLTRQPGRIAGEYLCGYAFARVVCEVFREPDASLVLGLSRGTLYSLAMFAAGLWLVFRSPTRRA
ncbi:MAG: prolipoprotein diacylglyceryl transferase [Verrucomicrobia bacterium]|nr:prolipoprotein diacylglyceryl transferase [Verrucomicrobiota bacterium]